jgi:hypothetical protein
MCCKVSGGTVLFFRQLALCFSLFAFRRGCVRQFSGNTVFAGTLDAFSGSGGSGFCA